MYVRAIKNILNQRNKRVAMKYEFGEDEKVKVCDNFGKDFYDHVNGLMDVYLDKWSISKLELVDSFSANLVFKGSSKASGPIILKFGRDDHEFTSEVAALKAFDQAFTCQLIDFDEAQLVLMEECLEPGTTLFCEPNLLTRLEAFCYLYTNLHHSLKAEDQGPESIDHGYQSYKDWIFRITDYMSQQEGWQEVADHMTCAKEIFVDLSKTYNKQTLLHGDLHYYNILKSGQGYKVIDPKGVIGDPVFDLPRYILNEFWDEEEDALVDEKMTQVFRFISQAVDLPEDHLKKLLYMEGALSMSWNVESGAKLDEKAGILKTITWLEKYMKA